MMIKDILNWMQSVQKRMDISDEKSHYYLFMVFVCPGVPVIPLCKPFLSKQPTIFHGENAMTIMFDTV